jgi:hypothetical protein
VRGVLSELSRLKQSLEEKNLMDPHISVLTAILNSIAQSDENGVSVAEEVDFVPFNLSYLRDFSEESEEARNPLGGRDQNAPDALPA